MKKNIIRGTLVKVRETKTDLAIIEVRFTCLANLLSVNYSKRYSSELVGLPHPHNDLNGYQFIQMGIIHFNHFKSLL